jgi:hypothetical protein
MRVFGILLFSVLRQVVGGLRMRGAFQADAAVEVPVDEFQGRCVHGTATSHAHAFD